LAQSLGHGRRGGLPNSPHAGLRARDERAPSSPSDNEILRGLGASGTKRICGCTLKMGQRCLLPEEEEEGEGRAGKLLQPRESRSASWKRVGTGAMRSSKRRAARRRGGMGGRQPPAARGRTHRRGTVTGVRVVLDFPQSLVEAFPLVWFPIFVFIFFIREEIFRAQEGAGEKQSRGEPGAEAARSKPREGGEAALTSRGCRRRRWGTCSVGVSQRRPRCHRSERKPKAGGGQRERLEHVLREARQPWRWPLAPAPTWRQARQASTRLGTVLRAGVPLRRRGPAGSLEE